MFSSGSLKSLGPDGMPGLFYRKNWGVVGADIVVAVQSFFQGKYPLKQLNHTFVALVLGLMKPLPRITLGPLILVMSLIRSFQKILDLGLEVSCIRSYHRRRLNLFSKGPHMITP